MVSNLRSFIKSRPVLDEPQFFSLLLASPVSGLRLLDLMFLQRDRTASSWLYTTPSGQLLSRGLASMPVEDLIVAILCNIEGRSQLVHADIVVSVDLADGI